MPKFLLCPLLALMLSGCFSSEPDPLNDLYADGEQSMSRLLEDSERIEFLYKQQRGGQVVNSLGRIVKILEDQQQPFRAQQLLIRLNSGQKLLLQHNIDKAQPLPELTVGEVIEFKGVYKWNSKGGIIIDTQLNEALPKNSGYLKYRDLLYQ